MPATNLPEDIAPANMNQQPPKNCDEASATAVLENWRPLWWLPCELALQVPLKKFSVGDLLRLGPGGLVSTGWSRSTEVPVYANGQRIGSSEFEAVGDRIGARITELI